MHELLQLRWPSRSLRPSNHNLLNIPRTCTAFVQRSFAHAAPRVWNSLPHTITDDLKFLILNISAPVFAARCYASAAYAVMRCLYVCVSVTFVSCIKTNKHIIKMFSPSGSHTILVFPCRTGWRYSDGKPSNGGVECKGYEKITIHEQFSCVYARHCEIKSGVNTTKNVNDYNNVWSEIRFLY